MTLLQDIYNLFFRLIIFFTVPIVVFSSYAHSTQIILKSDSLGIPEALSKNLTEDRSWKMPNYKFYDKEDKEFEIRNFRDKVLNPLVQILMALKVKNYK